jgi:hypothetical protein
MTQDQRLVTGTIKILTCNTCSAKVPLVTFDGEADVDTIGLCSAGSCERLDVAIVEAALTEWNDLADSKPEGLQVRISQELGRNDLHVVSVKRVESGSEAPSGTSFAEFRKAYRAPILVYSCPCCGTGEATETEELTVDAFAAAGGEILGIGGLSLQNPSKAR